MDRVALEFRFIGLECFAMIWCLPRKQKHFETLSVGNFQRFQKMQNICAKIFIFGPAGITAAQKSRNAAAQAQKLRYRAARSVKWQIWCSASAHATWREKFADNFLWVASTARLQIRTFAFAVKFFSEHLLFCTFPLSSSFETRGVLDKIDHPLVLLGQRNPSKPRRTVASVNTISIKKSETSRDSWRYHSIEISIYSN